ncbi:pyrroline-5-carboxylate reductase [Candidatus Acetothermia bacterium]|nr:pyrroline-5-carboxylate reductase [Candidatus Acetothermia bacterium]MBI3643053.1 pyrroline-5-carboxylate reductase [Candidatus Acetothermia bacterium]
MLQDKKITVIGLGKIGGTLASSLICSGTVKSEYVKGTTAHPESAANASQKFGFEVCANNANAVQGSDIVVLSVKPQNMGKVLNEIREVLEPHQLIITLAAAVRTRYVEEQLGTSAKVSAVPVVRAMPNTPCLVGQGMTVLCPGRHASREQIELAREVFSAVGLVEVIDNEDLMDAVTGLSGSGPAYGYIIIESLAEGGVKVGLPRDLATRLAAQTMLGAAQMVIETGEHPAKLKDAVTTPAGTTVDGIMELEDGGLRVALIKAVSKATQKSKELSR